MSDNTTRKDALSQLIESFILPLIQELPPKENAEFWQGALGIMGYSADEADTIINHEGDCTCDKCLALYVNYGPGPQECPCGPFEPERIKVVVGDEAWEKDGWAFALSYKELQDERTAEFKEKFLSACLHMAKLCDEYGFLFDGKATEL